MKYVQATKPEKHNGGPFYEHEIHIDIPQRDYTLKRRIQAFMEGSVDQKHTDYRISMRTRQEPWEGRKDVWSPIKVTTYTAVVRFKDKNKAMMFKLSFPL